MLVFSLMYEDSTDLVRCSEYQAIRKYTLCVHQASTVLCATGNAVNQMRVVLAVTERGLAGEPDMKRMRDTHPSFISLEGLF